MSRIEKYISLSEAARYLGCYSQEYLSLRARQGKLKATKFGRNWVTTKEWLNEYLERVNNYKEKINNYKNNKKNQVTDRNLLYSFSSLINYLQPVRKLRLITVTYALVFLLLSAGIVFSYPYLGSTLKSVGTFIENTSSKLATDIWDFSDNVSTNIRQFAFDTSKDINNTLRNLTSGTERAGELSQNIFIESGKAIKSFSKDLKFGLAFLKEEINEDLILPFINFFSSFRTKSQPEMTFGEYLRNDFQNLKEFVKKITKAIAYPFVKSYQFIVRPWSERAIEEQALKEVLEKVSEVTEEEIETLRSYIEKLEREGIVVKEIVKEVKQITQIQPVTEITKRVIDSEALADIRSQISKIQGWESDIKTLQVLTSKLQTHPPSTQITTAPIYIASQGLQVEGVGIFSSLGVSGSAGITNLGVGDSTSLGSDSSDRLTVHATSEFFSPVTIQNTFTVGDSTNYLTIDSTGNLNTTGNVTISGDLTVTGAQTYSGAAAFTASSTSAALSVNQTGSGDIVNFQDSGTTVFAISDGGNITMTGNFTITGSATTTGSMYAETYYSTSTDSTVRKSGEEVLRASVSIYRYEMPSQTSTTTYFRISKYFSENPLSSTPPALPGATRVYRLIIKYSDDIATSSTSLWRIYRTTAATTSDTFTLSGLGESALTEGTPYLTDILTISDTDWQVEMKLLSDSNQVRIFQIYLSAYDQIN